jgi:lipocalin-like protein
LRKTAAPPNVQDARTRSPDWANDDGGEALRRANFGLLGRTGRATQEDQMHRRGVLAISAMAALGFALLSGEAAGQQKSIKDQLVGTWTLLVSDGVTADGTHLPTFGPNPMGSLIFTADGHYSLEIMRVGRKAFASNNFAAGTTEENKAAMSGSFAHFGTYTANDAERSFTFRVEASLFPNWEGTRQTRTVTALTDEVLTYKFSGPPIGGIVGTELVWKKTK